MQKRDIAGGQAISILADVTRFVEIEAMREPGADRVAPDSGDRNARRVAQAALFLVTEQSAWVTGIVLDVAGGA